MKITKQELIELKACKDGLDRFIAQTNNSDDPIEVSTLVGGENYYSDLLWLASKKLPRERIVRFACDCALLNIKRIKPYTDDYDMIVEFLHNPTARSAHAAVDITARAARAACFANAAGAATRALVAVVYSADTVWSADTAAVYAAAGATGNKEKVEELLKNLFV